MKEGGGSEGGREEDVEGGREEEVKEGGMGRKERGGREGREEGIKTGGRRKEGGEINPTILQNLTQSHVRYILPVKLTIWE